MEAALEDRIQTRLDSLRRLCSGVGKHTDDFRGGNYAEYLTQFVFSTIGFVAPIPRQEDFFLSDLFVHLHVADRSGKRPGYVPMGQSLTVQVKSNQDAITLTESETSLVVERAAIPWFIAVRSRGGDEVKLYSSIDRHLLRDQPPAACTLTFDDRPPTLDAVDKPNGTLPMGPPIITVSLKALVADEANDSAERRRLWAVVGTWAWADALNIGLRAKRIPLFARPQGVPTGETVRPEHLEPLVLGANPDVAALAGAVGEAVISLRAILDSHPARADQSDWLSGLVNTLNELIDVIKAKL